MTNKPQTRREREIWEACDALYGKVEHIKDITGDKIMSQLLNLGYKKGCANEVYKYRRSWWKLRGISEDEAKGININNSVASNSSSFSDPIAKAVSIVQDELKQEADNKINKIESDLQQTIKKLEDEIESLYIRNNELVVSKTKLESELENSVLANENLNQELNNLNTELAKSSSNLNIIIKEKQTNMELFEKNIKDLKASHTEAIESLKTALEDNRHQYIYDTDRLQSIIGKNKLSIDELSTELSSVRAELEKVSGENIILRNKCYNYESENAKLLDHVDSQERLLEQSNDIYRNIIRKMHNKEDLMHKQNIKLDLIGENLTKILSKYIKAIEPEEVTED